MELVIGPEVVISYFTGTASTLSWTLENYLYLESRNKIPGNKMFRLNPNTFEEQDDQPLPDRLYRSTSL